MLAAWHPCIARRGGASPVVGIHSNRVAHTRPHARPQSALHAAVLEEHMPFSATRNHIDTPFSSSIPLFIWLSVCLSGSTHPWMEHNIGTLAPAQSERTYCNTGLATLHPQRHTVRAQERGQWHHTRRHRSIGRGSRERQSPAASGMLPHLPVLVRSVLQARSLLHSCQWLPSMPSVTSGPHTRHARSKSPLTVACKGSQDLSMVDSSVVSSPQQPALATHTRSLASERTLTLPNPNPNPNPITLTL